MNISHTRGTKNLVYRRIQREISTQSIFVECFLHKKYFLMNYCSRTWLIGSSRGLSKK